MEFKIHRFNVYIESIAAVRVQESAFVWIEWHHTRLVIPATSVLRRILLLIGASTQLRNLFIFSGIVCREGSTDSAIIWANCLIVGHISVWPLRWNSWYVQITTQDSVLVRCGSFQSSWMNSRRFLRLLIGGSSDLMNCLEVRHHLKLWKKIFTSMHQDLLVRFVAISKMSSDPAVRGFVFGSSSHLRVIDTNAFSKSFDDFYFCDSHNNCVHLKALSDHLFLCESRLAWLVCRLLAADSWIKVHWIGSAGQFNIMYYYFLLNWFRLCHENSWTFM